MLDDTGDDEIEIDEDPEHFRAMLKFMYSDDQDAVLRNLCDPKGLLCLETNPGVGV